MAAGKKSVKKTKTPERKKSIAPAGSSAVEAAAIAPISPAAVPPLKVQVVTGFPNVPGAFPDADEITAPQEIRKVKKPGQSRGDPVSIPISYETRKTATVRVDLAGNVVLFTALNTFLQEHGATRSGAAGEDSDAIVFPSRLRAALSRGDRGEGELIEAITVHLDANALVERATEWLEKLEANDVDLQKYVTEYVLKSVINKAAAKSAWALCYWREHATLKGHTAYGQQGMIQLEFNDANSALPDATHLQFTDPVNPALTPDQFRARIQNTDASITLLLHGTASSTEGSFSHWGGLADVSGSPSLVFGYEHRSLTLGPVQNALDLVTHWLPDSGCTLRLVSHSRGGMIGELLSRYSAKNITLPMNAAELAALSAQDDQEDRYFKNSPDPTLLKQLRQVMRDKKVVVETFVRVACPVRGTILASDRLDRVVSLIFNAISLIPTSAPVLVEGLAEFCEALVATRSDPKVLPGLEAMRPDSALVGLLNSPSVMVKGQTLCVVAGEHAVPRWYTLTGLRALVIDAFYEQKNDWVVHTAGMIGGTRREAGRSLVLSDRGDTTTHFRYFTNSKTSQAVSRALIGTTTDFQPLQSSARGTTPGKRSATDALPPDVVPQQITKPVLFILPGIMASALSIKKDKGNESVWLNYPELLLGGMDKLDITTPENIVADGVVDSTYDALRAHFSASHHVVLCPFDWRKSLLDAAEKFAQTLALWLQAIKGSSQPVRIIAHSMGGLVVRTMMLEDRWRGICLAMFEHERSRLLMLGVPNRGSHSIAAALTAREGITQFLALTNPDAYELISKFPGVAELLPMPDSAGISSAEGAEDSWLDGALWDRLRELEPRGWSRPSNDLLAATKKLRERLNRQLENGLPGAANGKIIYVAGCARSTPYALDMSATMAKFNAEFDFDRGNSRFGFSTTQKGDGRVTWDSGRIRGVPTYYVKAVHGDLPDTRSAFDGYSELLERGRTQLLPIEEPVNRGVATPVVASTLLHFPDESDAIALALGRTPAGVMRTDAPAPVRIQVRHGSLEYARYPIMIGHAIHEDLANSAESRVDKLLDGRLTELQKLRIYPSALGTAHVVFSQWFALDGHDGLGLPGTIIVGLGMADSLSSVSLSEAIASALCEYAHRTLDRERNVNGWNKAKGPIGLGVSALLVGCSSLGLTINASVFAILRGVKQAQVQLQLADMSDSAFFAELEIIEWLEDRAIQAARSIRSLVMQDDMARYFSFDDQLKRLPGGYERVVTQDGNSRTQRLRITEDATGTLMFSLISQRARVDVRSQVTQPKLIDRLLTDAAHDALGANAATLFELLIPVELKDSLGEGNDTVLIVDDAAARYPWEVLLRARSSQGVVRALATEFKVIRQLETLEFRPTPVSSESERALVIGNPDMGDSKIFTSLTGAQTEAESVVSVLRAARFDTTESIRETAAEIIVKLFANPYRILHIAGHGAYKWLSDDDQKRVTAGLAPLQSPKTGIVLDEEVFLTASEIRALPVVPDLVFLNCCYSGRERADNDRKAAPLSSIAASVSVELIRIGVRAVVACGWAIDDGLATQFANEFYRKLFEGKTFAEALQAARGSVAASGGDTWGAYQAYGDPNFSFADSEQRARAPVRYFAANELLADIRNAASRASVAQADDSDALMVRLEALEATLATERDRWNAAENSALWAALAMSYGELACFDLPSAFERSIKAFETADKHGSLSELRAYETLATMYGRYAAYRSVRSHQVKMDLAGQTPLKVDEFDPTKLFAKAEKLLQQLDLLTPNHARTKLLRASLEMRKAWTFASDLQLASAAITAAETQALLAQFEAALVNARDFYVAADAVASRASESETKISDIDLAHGWIGIVAADALCGFCGIAPRPTQPGETPMKAYVEKLQTHRPTNAESSDAFSFWAFINVAEAKLASVVWQGQFNGGDVEQQIKAAYRSAFSRGVARKDWAAVLDRLEAMKTIVAYAHQKSVPAANAALPALEDGLGRLYDAACGFNRRSALDDKTR